MPVHDRLPPPRPRAPYKAPSTSLAAPTVAPDPSVSPLAAPQFTALPAQQGMGQNELIARRQEIVRGMGDIAAAFDNTGSGAGNAAARKGLQDQLRFGLEGIDLSREQLGLNREGFGLDQQTADLNRRDALEAVINNALQRGIYKSGIRIRNERRAGERADIVDERIDLFEAGADITGRRLDLNEEELRARIANSLAQLRAGAAANRAARETQMLLAQGQYAQSAEAALDVDVFEKGGVFPSVGTSVVRRPGGIF